MAEERCDTEKARCWDAGDAGKHDVGMLVTLECWRRVGGDGGSRGQEAQRSHEQRNSNFLVLHRVCHHQCSQNKSLNQAKVYQTVEVVVLI